MDEHYSIMDRVFKFMNRQLDYGWSIQIYEDTIQLWIEYSFLLINTLFNYGYSIKIYEYIIQSWT